MFGLFKLLGRIILREKARNSIENKITNLKAEVYQVSQMREQEHVGG
jgi:hypothetical protein